MTILFSLVFILTLIKICTSIDEIEFKFGNKLRCQVPLPFPRLKTGSVYMASKSQT